MADGGAQAQGKRRRLSPEERRAEIVDAAVAYFAEVGLDGDTRTLARRLGVTQSLIFNYFATKADLLEAVYARVYLGRLSPDWPALIADRSLPVGVRMRRFYHAYTEAIFTYEWMRIFMFSGLAGAQLNRRYLDHVRELILEPMLGELRAEGGCFADLDIEDLWALHGGLVYIGIRRFIYLTATPEDPRPAIDRTIARFLAASRATERGR
ncbi:MAG: TetR/AcrR family transcriptional regulator [Rubrimonas sp.]